METRVTNEILDKGFKQNQKLLDEFGYLLAQRKSILDELFAIGGFFGRPKHDVDIEVKEDLELQMEIYEMRINSLKDEINQASATLLKNFKKVLA